MTWSRLSFGTSLGFTLGGLSQGGDPSTPSAFLEWLAAAPDAEGVMQLQVTGVGTPTSTHAAVIYAADYQGICHAFAANEPVWAKGRVVENGITDSSDANQWSMITTNVISQTEINAPSDGGWFSVPADVYAAGTPIILSFRAKAGTSDRIRSQTAYPILGNTDITLTSEYKRYCVAGTVYSSGAIRFSILDAGSIHLTDVQLENATGRSDTTTPSEYVSTSASPSDGLQFVSNSDFSVDASGYSAVGGASLVRENDKGKFIGDGSQYANIEAANAYDLVVGRNYELSFDFTPGTYTGTVELNVEGQNASPPLLFSGTSEARHCSVKLLGAQHVARQIRIRMNSAHTPGDYFFIDNVSIKEIPRTKTFCYQNRNTVASNVVTEGQYQFVEQGPWKYYPEYWNGSAWADNLLATGMPQLQYTPDATNSWVYSNTDIIHPMNGTPTLTLDQVGLTGEPNTAILLSDAQTDYPSVIRPEVATVADTSVHTFKTWVKKDENETRFPAFNTLYVGGAWNKVLLNTKTGAFNKYEGSENVEIVDDGLWWVVVQEMTNTNLTSLRHYIAPAMSDDFATESSSPTGSIILGQREVHLNKTITDVRGLPPIFTDSAAASINRTDYRWDLANHDQDNGAYFYNLESSISGSEIPTASYYSWLTASNVTAANLAFAKPDSGYQLGTYDGERILGFTGAWSRNVVYAHGVTYDATDALKTVYVDGVVSTITGYNEVYRGTYGAWANLFLAYSNPHTHYFSNIQRWTIPDYATGKTKIEELMVPYYGDSMVLEFNIASNGETLTIPARNVGTYNAVVDWGDGSTSTVTTYNDADLVHVYTTAGVYEVQISGVFPAIHFNNVGDKLKLLRILSWGDCSYDINQQNAFRGCTNLTKLLVHPDHFGFFNSTLTSASNMFILTALDGIPEGITLGSLTSAGAMFSYCNLGALPESLTLASLTYGVQMFKLAGITSIGSSLSFPALTNGVQIFNGNTINTADYSAMLVRMEAANQNGSVTFEGGLSTYNTAGGVARAALITDHGWTITDGGAA